MPKVQGCRGGYAQSPRCLALAVLLVCMSLGSTTASTHSCGDGEKIPIDRVNDGYCDCEDGSDELRTSACSGMAGIDTRRTFTCENRGHVPTDLYPSRLSDGICDCCDGSDEPKGACRNTCAVHARRKLEDIKAKLVQFEAGLNTRSQYVASSANALNDARAELQSAEAEAADLEKNFNALRQQLKEARRKAEGEQRTAVDDEDSTEPPSVEEMLLKNSVRQYFSKLASPHEMDPQALHDEVAPQHTNFDFSRERDRTVLARIAIDFVPEEAASGDDKPNQARKLAVEKLRAAIALAADHRKTVADGGGEDEFEDFSALPAASRRAVLRSLVGNVYADLIMDAAVMIWDATLGPLLDSNVTRLEKELARLTPRRQALSVRIAQLRGLLQADLRVDGAFHALHGRCFEHRVHDYLYKVCPYDRVEQRSALEGGSSRIFVLGHFETWASVQVHDPNALAPNGAPPPAEGMRFTRGESCGGPQQRRADVMVVCGSETVVISATEPRPCEYSLVLATPAACHAGPLARLSQRAAELETEVLAIETAAAKQEL